MLKNEELLSRFFDLDIPLEGRDVVEKIRASDPVRRVGGGGFNVACRYPSRKMGCVIQAESHKNELPWVYLWDHDQETDEFYDQPSQIKLEYINTAGKRSSHLATPDYFLIQKSWIGWVECKTEDELIKREAAGQKLYIKNSDGSWSCPAGGEFARQFGLGFKVLSSKAIDWPLTRNIAFLSDYLDTSYPDPDDAQVRLIKQCFEGQRWICLEDLLTHEGVIADCVFTLIARSQLFFDIDDEFLSEAWRTKICESRLNLEAYIGFKKSQSQTTVSAIPALQIAVGAQFLWDGKPWKILNVGDTELTLIDETKTVSTLNHEVFEGLVQNGGIQSCATNADASDDLALDIVNKASPKDIEIATRRHHILVGGDIEGISARTLRYWKRKQKNAEMIFGNGFSGLIPRVSARGNRTRKVLPEVIDLMDQVIRDYVMTSDDIPRQISYGTLRNLCKGRNLIPPSSKTFYAQIRRNSEYELIRTRKGDRAAYEIVPEYWVIDQSTPVHGERAFEVGHIDHTQIDLQMSSTKSGANCGKAWLTILFDAYTREVLGAYLTFDAPSYRSCMAVIMDALKRHNRIPKIIVVDNGSDFESSYFEGLLARLDRIKKSRPPAKSHFGSVMERFFGVANQQLIHSLAGNNKALQNPRSMSSSHDPRKLAVWTLARFTELFDNYAFHIYPNMIHSALGVSPKEMRIKSLARSGVRAHTLIPWSESVRMLCLPSTRTGMAQIDNARGIKINGIVYHNDALRDPLLAKKSVDVRYDPFDVSKGYAYINGEWILCRSSYASKFSGKSEKEIRAISQEIRAINQLKETGRNIKAEQVAAFIDENKQSESVLRQQRKDAERKAAAEVEVLEPESNFERAFTNEANPKSGQSYENFWANPIECEYVSFGELK